MELTLVMAATTLLLVVLGLLSLNDEPRPAELEAERQALSPSHPSLTPHRNG